MLNFIGRSINAELTPWSIVLIEKLIVTQLRNKFPTIFSTRRFIPCLQEPEFNAGHKNYDLFNFINLIVLSL
jgi:hypothetical protein